MGCHTWIYKKIASEKKDVLNKKLKEAVESSKSLYYLTASKKEWSKDIFDYYKNESVDCWKRMLEKYPDSQTEIRKKYQEALDRANKMTIEDVYKEYDDLNNHYKEMVQLAEKFYSLAETDNDMCNDLFRFFDSYSLREINNEMYYEIYFDTIFRVYGYPEEKFTDIDELIKWLYSYNQNLIVDYDENGKPIEPSGMSQRLEDKLRKLWAEHNNTLQIHFG